MEELHGDKMVFQEYLCAAVEIAKKAGEEIRATFQAKKTIELKSSPADLVTETDQKVEQLIIAFLKSKFPDHGFIGEETTAAGGHCHLSDDPTWIIDPVDGTTNFVHSFPYVSISIGLAVNKENVVGVIYNPILDEMFTAIKGQGAYCNGKPIMCSRQEDITQSLVIAEIGSSRAGTDVQTKVDNISAVLKQGVHGVRSMGSAALNICNVARGSGDAYFEYGLHCWDMAAGDIILREAGGVTIDPRGGPFDMMSRCIVAASSQKLAESVAACITRIEYPRD